MSPGGTPELNPRGTPMVNPGGTPILSPGGTPILSPGGTPVLSVVVPCFNERPNVAPMIAKRFPASSSKDRSENSG